MLLAIGQNIEPKFSKQLGGEAHLSNKIVKKLYKVSAT
ncbi:hypothetical protein B4119_0599 [Parageobacillus caldoxylosilyticus]|uniref:Uncharacterized protein n=1 Tax=Saccharococcus caldoxylosilyticus TaxID=81408 RepID=A0A150L3F3_9BACL|nr:hypothetical protein B4119_0599 [Parageobacillus caldoxylosilyticus]